MILAASSSSYPLLNLVWTMFVFFSWILWFWLLIMVYTDMFRRKDIGGGAKTLWVIFTLLVPFIGVLTYLITQGRSMGERREQEAQQQRSAMDEYVRSVAATSTNGSGSNGADQIVKAKSLLDSGAITADEYDAMKRKVLA
jgi:type VI protein secretion system component VasK